MFCFNLDIARFQLVHNTSRVQRTVQETRRILPGNIVNFVSTVTTATTVLVFLLRPLRPAQCLYGRVPVELQYHPWIVTTDDYCQSKVEKDAYHVVQNTLHKNRARISKSLTFHEWG